MNVLGLLGTKKQHEHIVKAMSEERTDRGVLTDQSHKNIATLLQKSWLDILINQQYQYNSDSIKRIESTFAWYEQLEEEEYKASLEDAILTADDKENRSKYSDEYVQLCVVLRLAEKMAG